MVNYNKLYYFYIITLRGSMNQAAQQLYISQPALSKSVQGSGSNFSGSHIFDREKREFDVNACRGNIAQGMCADFFPGKSICCIRCGSFRMIRRKRCDLGI